LILTKLKDLLRTAEVREAQFRWQDVCWFLLIGFWLGFIVLDAATYLLLALVLSVGSRIPSFPHIRMLRRFAPIPYQIGGIVG
jgi:hypothetical protein